MKFKSLYTLSMHTLLLAFTVYNKTYYFIKNSLYFIYVFKFDIVEIMRGIFPILIYTIRNLCAEGKQ